MTGAPNTEPATAPVTAIVVWVCDECGYWRENKTSGTHVTPNKNDPRGKMLSHELKPIVFLRADTVGVL